MHEFDIRSLGNRLNKKEEVLCYLLFGLLCATLTIVAIASTEQGQDPLWLQIVAPAALLAFGSLFLFRLREWFKEKRIERMELLWEMVEKFHRMLIYDYRLLDTGDRRFKIESDQCRRQYEKLHSKAPRAVKRVMAAHITVTLKPYMEQGILNRDIAEFAETLLKKSHIDVL